MVFWTAVLVGGIFTWIALQIGFYATWILFFNLLLSVYVAIFLTPIAISRVQAATSTAYGYALTFLSIAVATLLISYGICWAWLSSEERIRFPKVLESLGAGLLGFLAGFLLASFLAVALCLTPLTQRDFFKKIGLDAESQESTKSYLCWWCDRLHVLVKSSADTEDTPADCEEAVQKLWDKAAELAAAKPPEAAPADVVPPDSAKPPAPSRYQHDAS
jgi:hypothetical protein